MTYRRGRPRPPAGWRAAPAPVLGLLVAVAYATLAKGIALMSSFSDDLASAAAFWPAAGLALAALLVLRRSAWPSVLLGVAAAELLVDLTGGVALDTALWWAAANVVEPLIAATLLARRGLQRLDLARMDHLVSFIGCAVLVGPAGGAVAGVLPLDGSVGERVVWWGHWLIGDAMGVLTVAPAVLLLVERRPQQSAIRWLPLAAAPVVLALVGFLPVQGLDHDSLAFFVIPSLVWVALRGGTVPTAYAVLGVAVVVNAFTALGWGPFATQEGFDGLVETQMFLGAVVVTAYLVAVLAHDLVRRTEVERRLRHQAEHDQLTGLANRRLLFERLADAGRGDGHPVALLLVDLDGFKAVNDTHGHSVGDEVLVETAHRIVDQTRATDLVARIGGDEFLVLVERLVSFAGIQRLAERIEAAVAVPVEVAGQPVQVGASVGVAIAHAGVLAPDEMVRLADDRMYVVKAQHRAAGSPPGQVGPVRSSG